MSVKRHSRQVLPTPESPISSSRNSTSYCFAMAGTLGGPRAAGGCGLSPAQPLPSRPEPAPGRRGGEKEAARPPRWPRPLARWLAGAGKRGCGGSAARRSSRGREVGGDSCGCRPCPALRPAPAPLLQREQGGREQRGPRGRPGRGPRSGLRPWGARTRAELERDTSASFYRRCERRSWKESPPSPLAPTLTSQSRCFSSNPTPSLILITPPYLGCSYSGLAQLMSGRSHLGSPLVGRPSSGSGLERPSLHQHSGVLPN